MIYQLCGKRHQSQFNIYDLKGQRERIKSPNASDIILDIMIKAPLSDKNNEL
jgi:hypothetical protein